MVKKRVGLACQTLDCWNSTERQYDGEYILLYFGPPGSFNKSD